MWAKVKSWILGLIFGGLALALLLWQAFSSGKSSQKSDEQQEILDNVKKAKESRQDTNNMSDDERIERMRKRSRK